MRGLRIIPGDAASAAAFRGRNRVRRFLQNQVAGCDHTQVDVEFGLVIRSLPHI